MNPNRLRLFIAFCLGLSGAVVLGAIGAGLAAMLGGNPLIGLFGFGFAGFLCGSAGALALLH